MVAHYKANKRYYVSKAKIRQQKVSADVDQLKAVPCADCGKSYPSYVMDFDHCRGKKDFNISTYVRSRCGSIKKLLEEIKKCDVVCSNCHRERTHRRMLPSPKG